MKPDISRIAFLKFDVFPAAPKTLTTSNGAGEVGQSSEMSCSFQAKPLPEIKWLRYGNPLEEDQAKYEIAQEKKNDIEVKSYLKILKYV